MTETITVGNSDITVQFGNAGASGSSGSSGSSGTSGVGTSGTSGLSGSSGSSGVSGSSGTSGNSGTSGTSGSSGTSGTSGTGLNPSDSPTFATVKCTGLTDGYIPKHTSDAVGLANSILYEDGSGHIGIGITAGMNAQLQLKQSIVGASAYFKVQNDSNAEISFKTDGSSVAGTLFGLTRTNLASFYSYLATGLVVGTFDNVPLYFGVNNIVRVTVGINGNVGIGAGTFGSNAAGVLAIKSGTAGTTSPANMVQLWADNAGTAGATELRVRDELGNVTTLSPHHIEISNPGGDVLFPFTMYHKNDLLGIEEEVDMGGLIKAVEALTGKQFSFTRSIPKLKISDYYAEREMQYEKELMDSLSYEEEIEEEFATEIKEVEEATKDVEDIKEVYSFTDGVKKIDNVPQYKTLKIDKVVLKEGVRCCENTGKFFIKRTPTRAELDMELAKRPVNNLPKWILDRI